MKTIYNKYIPFKGYKAINLFGVVFVRKGSGVMRKKDLNHEAIHTAQMKELLYVPFYILYFIEWLLKLIVCCNAHVAYRAISFEKEAYNNEKNLDYLESRKHYNWIKLL